MQQVETSDLLLVIDMQNVYLPGQPWACNAIEEASDYICRVIREFPVGQILFTQYIAPEDPKGVWKDYNHKNAEINGNVWLNEYIDKLKPYLNRNILYRKSTYSCCGSSQIKKVIEQYDRIFVTGVVAECCVLATVFDLIDMGKKVVYLKHGVAGKDQEMEKNVMKILEGFSPLHVIIA